MPLAVADLQLCHRHHVLTLAHRHVVVVHPELQVDGLPSHGLDLLHRVRTRGQDKEDGGCARGVVEGRLQDLLEGGRAIAIHVLAPVWQDVPDPLRKRTTQPVGAQAPEHQELLEGQGVEPLPVQGQLDVLGGQLVEPLLEAVWRVLLHVGGERIEALQLRKSQCQAPVLARQPFRQRVLHARHAGRAQQEIQVTGVVLLPVQLPFREQLEGEHRAEDQLVTLEQTPVHPAEDHHADHGDHLLGSGTDVLGWLRFINRFVYEADERVQRVARARC